MAQKELDEVTRRERLPTFEDRPRLPFVDAICKELIRWRPAVPLSKLLPSNHQRKRYDDKQVYLTQRQEMMSTMVSLSPRAGTLGVRICFAVC